MIEPGVIEHRTGLWREAERVMSELKMKAVRYHECVISVADRRRVAVADLGDSYVIVRDAGILMDLFALRKGATMDEIVDGIARMMEEDHMRLFATMYELSITLRSLSKCENELCKEVSEAFSQVLSVWQILRAGSNE